MSGRAPDKVTQPPLRALLPAHPQSRGPELPQRQFEFKRKRQAAACEPCREHKTKALKRKFDSLQGEATSLQQVYDLLRTRPEGEAESIFRRIRDGESHDSILQFVRHGDLLLQLSSTTGTSSRTDNDLNTEPVSSSSRSERQSPQLDRAVVGGTSSPASTQALASQDPQTGSSTAHRYDIPAHLDQYFDHYRGCEVVEPLLDEVRPSKWTTVMSNDAVMRSLLSQFFLVDYRWGSIFHKDYFLQDMASGDQAHCSSLLVNAILACSLHASREPKNRQQSWTPGGDPGYEFFTEATRLWDSEQESGNDRLTTVQAGLLLSGIHGIDSLDTMGWKCAARSIQMASSLGLFDSDTEMDDHHDSRTEHARLYTAWSAFCWQSLWCHHFFIPPLIRHPPPHHLPDPHDEPEWYGEIHVKYPSTDRVCATGHGHLFKAKADFAKTINNISDMSFSF